MKNEEKKIPFRLAVLSWIPTLISMAVVICIMVFLLVFLLPKGSLLSIVDGTSMDTTLHHGQIMFQAGKDFDRGDIVICTIPDSSGSKKTKVIVKRIIGMPDDEVSIDPSGVYINGEKLAETYLTPNAVAGTFRYTMYNHNQLGPTEYFLMGDNRSVSYDSRSFGPVAQSAILYEVSSKPSLPFFLMLGVVLLIGAGAFALNFWLDERITGLMCKHHPELAKLVEEEKQKNQKGRKDGKDAKPQE